MIRAVAFSLSYLLWSMSVAFAQNAADNYYDAADMAKARAAVRADHGAQINSLVIAERLEYHSGEGDPAMIWEGQGWIGSDRQKLWLKTEGEHEFDDERFKEVEFQALYSHAIGPFWDLQAGLRQDIKPDPSRSYAVLGMQGLAPYWFELDAALFLSNKGDLSARVEAEYEFRLTQRAVLQPRVEMNGSFSDDRAIGIGSGLSTADLGLRLRYEITREFAPYIGVSYTRSLGDTTDFQRNDGDDTDQVSFVAGLRFWF